MFNPFIIVIVVVNDFPNKLKREDSTRLASVLQIENNYHSEHGFYIKCLFLNAIPDPDFKYFSNSNALYLSVKAMNVIIDTGVLFLV
jgi:hypothetical protein